MQETGADEPAEIANHLGLGQELVELIIERNQGRRGDEPSEDGSLSPPASSRAQEFWILQDPWTRRLWPRMLTSWTPLPLEWVQPDSGRFGLQLGGTAKPLQVREAVAIPHPRMPENLEPPTPWQLLHVAQQHAGALANFGAQCLLLSEKPKFGHLLNYLFVDTSNVSKAAAKQGSWSWQVCDPIKGGVNLLFRRYLNDFIRKRDGSPDIKQPGEILQKLVEDIKESLGAEASDLILDRQDYREKSLAQLSMPASLAEEHPEAAKYLVEWHTRMLMATEEAISEPERIDHREHAVRNLQLAIEAFFCGRARSNPESLTIAHLLVEDAETNAINILAAATELGFTPPESLQILACSRGQAQSALVSRNNSIQAGLALSILEAVRDPLHPFRALAAQFPTLLLSLGKLLSLRNQISHGSAIAGEVTVLSNDIFTALKSSCGLSGDGPLASGALDNSTMLAHARLRQAVALEVDLKFGNHLPVHAFHSLVSIKRELAMAESVVHSPNGPLSDSALNVQSAVASTYRLLESLVEPVLHAQMRQLTGGSGANCLRHCPDLYDLVAGHWNESGIFDPEARQRVRDLLVQLLSQTSFSPPSEPCPDFWNSVLRVRPDRLIHALKGHKTPLSAKIASIIVITPLCKAFQQLARTHPAFVADCATVCHWRGHGDCRYAPGDPKEVGRLLDDLVSSLLPLQAIL